MVFGSKEVNNQTKRRSQVQAKSSIQMVQHMKANYWMVNLMVLEPSSIRISPFKEIGEMDK